MKKRKKKSNFRDFYALTKKKRYDYEIGLTHKKKLHLVNTINYIFVLMFWLFDK